MHLTLGLQTITWGDPQGDQMPGILATAADCGYRGVEIGWRRIVDTGVPRLAALLQAQGLELFASHVGGNLVDPSQADHERQAIDSVLDGLAELGASRLLYSVLRYHDDDQLARDLAALNAAAQRCATRGIQLLYHNHDWEFESSGRVFDALLGQTVPELGFCPDVGWLHKGGVDCVEALDRMGERVQALHFKDFVTREPGVNDFCGLGQGCVPFDRVAAWAAAQPRDTWWVIAEQDAAEGPPEHAAAGNADALRRAFSPFQGDTP